MSDKSLGIQSITNLIKGHIEDQIIREELEKIVHMKRKELKTDAETRRKKSSELVKIIARIQFSIKRVERQMDKIGNKISKSGRRIIDDELDDARREIERYSIERKRL